MTTMVLGKLKKLHRGADDDYLVALDIGTEFVKALIAKLEGDELHIVGVGRARQEVSDMHGGAIADISGVVRKPKNKLVFRRNALLLVLQGSLLRG